MSQHPGQRIIEEDMAEIQKVGTEVFAPEKRAVVALHYLITEKMPVIIKDAVTKGTSDAIQNGYQVRRRPQTLPEWMRTREATTGGIAFLFASVIWLLIEWLRNGA